MQSSHLECSGADECDSPNSVTAGFQLRRPAPVCFSEDGRDLPTPTVDDCPTPLLAAMTGLQLSRMPLTPEKPSSAQGAAAPLSPRWTREKTKLGPRSLPMPFVLQPRAECAHAATVIMLHGFTSSGKQLASGWVCACAARTPGTMP